MKMKKKAMSEMSELSVDAENPKEDQQEMCPHCGSLMKPDAGPKSLSDMKRLAAIMGAKRPMRK
jgi:hypothetical protein